MFFETGWFNPLLKGAGGKKNAPPLTCSLTNHCLLLYFNEYLDSFNLINMPAHRSFSEGGNGRFYDPVIGRFLSPDNIVQSPEFTQSYNRYSYAFNNPLRFTDPSGNEGLGEDMILHWLNQGYPIDDVVFMIMDGADPASAMEDYIRMVGGFIGKNVKNQHIAITDYYFVNL